MIDEINNYSPEMRRIIGLGVHETVHQFFTWAIDHGYYQDETEDFGSENIHNYWGICISNIAGFAKKEKCIEGFLKYVYENNGDFDLFSDPCAKRIGDSTMNYILAARDAGVLPIYSEREISDAHGNTYRIDQTWKHHISDLKVDFSFDGTIPTAKRVKDRQQMEKYVDLMKRHGANINGAHVHYLNVITGKITTMVYGSKRLTFLGQHEGFK